MINGKQNNVEFNLDALRGGDKVEFARLVEAYSGVIYRLALKMLRDTQDAEDILQETFVKAYRHLSGFDGRSSLSTWLYRIATNEALMFLRRRREGQISIDDPSESGEQDAEALQIVDWCCIPEVELMSGEARHTMQQAIDNLPESLRTVFVLRDIEGLSTREVGQVLDLSEVAVKTRLSRARLRLRQALTSYFGEQIGAQQEVPEGDA